MACYALEILGLVLGITGVFGSFAVTLMPQWKVSAHTGGNILVSEIMWEGLWMSCVSRTSGVRTCLNYKSILALKTHVVVSRGLMCTACALSVIAFLTAIPAIKCFKYPGSNQQNRNKMLLAAGIIFLLTGIIVLIPVSWFANTIIKEFYNPAFFNSPKPEMGEALYLGWATSAFLIIGGGILCSFCHHAKNPGRFSPSSHGMNQPEYIDGKPASVHSYI